MIEMFNAYLASKHSRCVKSKVGCFLSVYLWDDMIEDLEEGAQDDYHFFTGYNDSFNSPDFCPRNLVGANIGERYDLCKNICHQKYHAEECALNNMMEYINENNGEVRGTVDEDVDDFNEFIGQFLENYHTPMVYMIAYLYGIDRLCDRCKNLLTKFGFTVVWICEKHCDLFNTNRWQRVLLK